MAKLGNRCTGRDGRAKRRWATAQAAEFVAAWQTSVKRNPQGFYQCSECGGWHVYTARTKEQIARAMEHAESMKPS